jgi:hypothetical protein
MKLEQMLQQKKKEKIRDRDPGFFLNRRSVTKKQVKF